jgi:quercetin dioxygenase-like cupin family protein
MRQRDKQNTQQEEEKTMQITTPISGLTGLSICTHVTDRASAILTYDQLGGQGEVFNHALIIPGHLQQYGSPLRSLEWVTMAPTHDPAGPVTIGEHQQETDELYFLVFGDAAKLTTNGQDEIVHPGDLVLAPKGTRHRLQNLMGTAFGFLVAEVQAPGGQHEPTIVRSLPHQLTTAPFHSTNVPPRVANVNLHQHFSGPWGELLLVEIPPGGRLFPYREDRHDQNLFIPAGNATLLIENTLRVNSEGNGLNAFVPAGLLRGLINQSSRDPLLVLVLNFERDTEGNGQRDEE